MNIQKTNSSESHKPQTQPSRSLPLRERQLFRGPCFFYRLRAGLCYFLSTTKRPASPFRPLGTPEKWDRRKNPLAIKKELPEEKKSTEKRGVEEKSLRCLYKLIKWFLFFSGFKINFNTPIILLAAQIYKNIGLWYFFCIMSTIFSHLLVCFLFTFITQK